MRWNARRIDEGAREREEERRRGFAESAVHREGEGRIRKWECCGRGRGDRGSSGVTVPT